jgi:organic radical activating enzyme
LPGATSIFLVILINEIPDINSDRLANKNNLAVRLGKEKAAILYSVLLILCYLNIIAIIFVRVPPISALLSIILIPLTIWNIVTLKRKGLDSREVKEGLSLRTMLFDHLITIIYAITFIVAGLSLITIRLDYLVILAVTFVLVFGLEGLGIAAIGEFRMLALGGGEPLVRPDIFELVAYARSLGLEISIATNGTLLTPEMAREFKKMGVANIAIGLNANDESVHEQITRVPGSFEKTKRGIYATKEAGMNLQINTTVMKENRLAIPGLLDFASEIDAQIVLLYQLVPEGRGDEEMELSIKENKELTEMIAVKQKTNRAIIEPTCSPQYWAYLISQNGNKPSRLGRS